MKSSSILFLLSVILVIGAFLRFHKLTSVPPSLSHDEVAIAYNAYSILKTGKDEYGKRFPLLFRSFDDYKLPGMVYSSVASVAFFGKSELAARLPSAIYGLLSILVIFGISYELLSAKRFIALLPALALAISPWHINFSRQLFESNGAVFWFMTGIYFLLRSRKNYQEIIWAGLAFVVSLYFYYSVRLVIPFIILIYIGFHREKIIKEWKLTVLALVISFIAFFPIGKEMFTPGGLERVSIVSVANDPGYIKRRDEYVQKMGTNPSFSERIRYNRRVALTQTVLENYWKNISPHNLFVTGTGTYGALFPFDALLVPLGFIMVAKFSAFARALICIWLFCAFLPGAFSINQPNTLRTLIAAPAFALLSGFGAYKAYEYITRIRIAPIYLFYFCIFLLTYGMFTFTKFHRAYFVDNPTNNAIAFGDGNKQMVEYIIRHHHLYESIYITGYYWRPYIFLLYWGDFEPTKYQEQGNREKFEKFIFASARWDTSGLKFMDPSFDPNNLPTNDKTLFILSESEFQMHQKHFMLKDTINGRVKHNIFVASAQR